MHRLTAMVRFGRETSESPLESLRFPRDAGAADGGIVNGSA